MLYIRLIISFLLSVAFLPGTLAAQDMPRDSGEYVILSAQYGTERQHVDVTNRLKELARQDRVFWMDNRTFGVDPDQGQVKTLRIYARGPDGRERMFEYREGSQVDGSQFRGWGRGDWGTGGWSGHWQIENDNRDARVERFADDHRDNRDSGEYVILTAQYGTERHHVDVTNRLKELARQDRTFYMNNNAFGVDPDFGQVKTLRIYARGPDGRERMFDYPEHSTVDGSQFRSWSGGDWGREGWSGRWEGGGGDSDHDRNRFDRGGDRDSGEYVILGAQYGTKRHHVDVTDRLKELARQDRTFLMDNRTFGIDPDRGRVKVLRIYSRGPGGRDRMFEYREGSTVDGSQFRGWGRGDWARERWNGRW